MDDDEQTCTCQQRGDVAAPSLTVATGTNPVPVVTADASETDTSNLPAEWHAVLVLEGVRTTDGREIAPNALATRPLPLPLMLITENTWGHEGAEVCGSIVTVDRDASTGQIMATGTFDLGGEEGQEAARLIGDQVLRWVSADLEPIEWEWVEDAGGEEFVRVTRGNIMGATVCPFPAFPQAVIAPADVALPDASNAGQDAAAELGMIPSAPAPVSVAAAAAPLEPPAAWFADPHLAGPTPMTVTDDGRIFGHAALWGTCHTGREDVCLSPPRSASSYAYFQTGALRALTADSAVQLPVGVITMATGHAPLTQSHRAAAAHYDDTGTAVADVAVGEDDFGIWFAGALRSDAGDEQVRALRASSLSGDWRTIGGSLELVALLAVNVPGFPVPRPAAGVTAAAGQLALVAAGVVEIDPTEETIRRVVAEELAPLRALLASLNPVAVEQLQRRFVV